MMYLLLGVSGTNSFDDLNGWERLRLTMPLSRRDVVLARYGAIATLGLGGLALGLATAVALGAVALFIPLPGELSSALALSGDALLGMCLSAGALFAVGSLCAAVEVPLFFRFGNTRTTQYLPLVPLFVLLCPIIVAGGSGMIDGRGPRRSPEPRLVTCGRGGVPHRAARALGRLSLPHSPSSSTRRASSRGGMDLTVLFVIGLIIVAVPVRNYLIRRWRDRD